MKRLLTATLVAVFATAFTTSVWSQTDQSGGAGTAGTAGPAGPATAPGAAGTAGTAGVGAPSVPPNVNIGANPQSQGVGANPASSAPGFGMNIQQSPFFSDPGARRQLNLDDNQFNTLNRAYQDAYGRYSQNYGRINSNLTLLERERLARQYENDFYNDYGRTVDRTFTDPRYRMRYDQLHRQYLGFNAFNNRAIQQQLNLTPQQWSQMYSQYWEQMNSILNPDQQRLWLNLTGERYTFSPNLYFPRSGQNVNGNLNPPVNPNDTTQPGTGSGSVVPYGNAPGSTQNPSNGAQQTPQGDAANSGTEGTVR